MERMLARALIAWFCLACTLQAQGVQAELERLIELKGRPKSRAPVITAIAIQPKGNLLATAGDDHLIRLWDLSSGRLVHQLRGHKDWITAVAFTSQGQELISGSRDRRVLLWDVATGKPKAALGRHAHPVTSIVVGPGDVTAVTFFGAPLKLIDLRQMKLQGTFVCPCTDTRAVAFSKDSKYLAAAGRSGKVRVWLRASGEKFDLAAANGRRVRALLFAGENRLLVGGDGAEVGIWDLQTRERLGGVPNASGKVLSMTIVGSDVLAVSGSDNRIRLYGLHDHVPHAVLRGHTGSIAALTARDGKIISGSFDTTVRVWNTLARTATTAIPAASTRVISTNSP